MKTILIWNMIYEFGVFMFSDILMICSITDDPELPTGSMARSTNWRSLEPWFRCRSVRPMGSGKQREYFLVRGRDNHIGILGISGYNVQESEIIVNLLSNIGRSNLLICGSRAVM